MANQEQLQCFHSSRFKGPPMFLNYSVNLARPGLSVRAVYKRINTGPVQHCLSISRSDRSEPEDVLLYCLSVTYSQVAQLQGGLLYDH